MERREFVTHSILLGLTGSAATAASSCATFGPRVSTPLATPVDMHQYLHELDTSLAMIQHGDFFGDLRAAAGSEPIADPTLHAQREALARKTLRAMTIADAFLDLGEDDRHHPGMQARMWGALDEIDDAVQGTAALLANTPESDRRALSERLNGDHDVLRDTAAALDDKAALVGLPPKRRRHLQRMFSLVGERARDGATNAMVDHFVDMVAKTAREMGQRGAQTAAPIAPVSPDGTQQAPPPPDQPPPPPTDTTLAPIAVGGGPVVVQTAPMYMMPPPRPPRRERDGRVALSTGAITLGLGVAVGLGGLAMVVASGDGGFVIVGLFLVTAGVVGLIMGLIFLIIGATRGIQPHDPVPG